ncbi:hypothetical protein ACET3Z_000558 [Daucus carota]
MNQSMSSQKDFKGDSQVSGGPSQPAPKKERVPETKEGAAEDVSKTSGLAAVGPSPVSVPGYGMAAENGMKMNQNQASVSCEARVSSAAEDEYDEVVLMGKKIRFRKRGL